VTLRVMTANLWSRRSDPAALASLLEEEQPDVLAVQELGPEQADAIARVMPHGRLEPRLDCEGMGIALRHPASVTPLALPRRNARIARLVPGTWPGLEAPLEVVNLHVVAPHQLPPWRTFATRFGQVRGLARWLDTNPHPARVVCGDLNATPIWPAYRQVASRLRDVALAHAAASGGSPARTWGPWYGAPRLLRLDHVFASGGRVIELRERSVLGSDHTALLVEFEF
jgi:endonuclease/exonuclease/phosphatase (EEP) superfamily protein YafD